ncbi:MAG: 50S ribosomal protein L22 [Deltaproteobacteria bacterium]|jgi:large subunit ribosomal protein L22|nr:50S ribosomal protein L22 [Deltaproteobacteria bacterium]
MADRSDNLVPTARDISKRHGNKIALSEARKLVSKCVKRNQRGCPDKIRLAAQPIVGKPVARAQAILKMSPTKGALVLSRCLRSAVENALMVHKLELDALFVERVMVDRGPMFKRVHPVSHGMAKSILKRTCHVTVIVTDKENKNALDKVKSNARALIAKGLAKIMKKQD